MVLLKKCGSQLSLILELNQRIFIVRDYPVHTVTTESIFSVRPTFRQEVAIGVSPTGLDSGSSNSDRSTISE